MSLATNHHLASVVARGGARGGSRGARARPPRPPQTIESLLEPPLLFLREKMRKKERKKKGKDRKKKLSAP